MAHSLTVVLQSWDDVERRVRPPEKPYDFSRSRPLQQEQSKLSLAEVYEQEYIKHTQVSVGWEDGEVGVPADDSPLHV